MVVVIVVLITIGCLVYLCKVPAHTNRRNKRKYAAGKDGALELARPGDAADFRSAEMMKSGGF